MLHLTYKLAQNSLETVCFEIRRVTECNKMNIGKTRVECIWQVFYNKIKKTQPRQSYDRLLLCRVAADHPFEFLDLHRLSCHYCMHKCGASCVQSDSHSSEYIGLLLESVGTYHREMSSSCSKICLCFKYFNCVASFQSVEIN